MVKVYKISLIYQSSTDTSISIILKVFRIRRNNTSFSLRRYINSSVTRRSMRRRFAWYCLYAVLLPVLLLIVTVTMDLSPAVPSTYLKPNFGVVGCWFKSKKCYFNHKHVLYVDVILETSSEIPWFLLIKVGLDIFFILYTLSGQFYQADIFILKTLGNIVLFGI